MGLANASIVPAEDLNRDYILHPHLVEEKCIGCGRCHISCHDGAHQAIIWNAQKRRPSFDRDRCVGCMLCMLVCPVKAIIKGDVTLKPGRQGNPAAMVV